MCWYVSYIIEKVFKLPALLSTYIFSFACFVSYIQINKNYWCKSLIRSYTDDTYLYKYIKGFWCKKSFIVYI